MVATPNIIKDAASSATVSKSGTWRAGGWQNCGISGSCISEGTGMAIPKILKYCMILTYKLSASATIFSLINSRTHIHALRHYSAFCIPAGEHIHTYIHTCIHTYIRIRIRTHKHTHTHKHKHKHTHMHTYMHTHTRIHTQYSAS